MFDLNKLRQFSKCDNLFDDAIEIQEVFIYIAASVI